MLQPYPRFWIPPHLVLFSCAVLHFETVDRRQQRRRPIPTYVNGQRNFMHVGYVLRYTIFFRLLLLAAKYLLSSATAEQLEASVRRH